ncbi:MAG TPA: cupin domain-containing protein [Pirellulaceae bacterium]|nr:cupin domain-containing protein [Pirellulaceae bacterium]
MNAPIKPVDVAESLDELWSPRVIGEVDDVYIKVAKVQGQLAWHAHDHEDELFLVLRGTLRIEMDAQTVEFGAGELFIVPKGVRHNPIADEECLLLLVERKSTQHTGDVVTDRTRSIAEQLRPLKEA